MLDMLGITDAVECASGSCSGCAWLAVGVIPVGKLAKLAKLARAGKKGKKAPNACRVSSFVPGTLVLMADGSYKPIEDVQLGDRVIATDPETGETTAQPVTALITGDGFKTLVEITVDVDGDQATPPASSSPPTTIPSGPTTKANGSTPVT